MLHSATNHVLPSGPASPSGLVDFEELGELLRVSRPIARAPYPEGPHVPPLFQNRREEVRALRRPAHLGVEQLARAA